LLNFPGKNSRNVQVCFKLDDCFAPEKLNPPMGAEGGADSWHPVVSHASVSPAGAEACSQRPFGVLEGAGSYRCPVVRRPAWLGPSVTERW